MELLEPLQLSCFPSALQTDRSLNRLSFVDFLAIYLSTPRHSPGHVFLNRLALRLLLVLSFCCVEHWQDSLYIFLLIFCVLRGEYGCFALPLLYVNAPMLVFLSKTFMSSAVCSIWSSWFSAGRNSTPFHKPAGNVV